jgi:hypothetical protein
MYYGIFCRVKLLWIDVSEIRVASIIRQYIPEDNSELHTRRREYLKSHTFIVTTCFG